MSVNYPLGTITPNLGLSLIGQDEVIAENFILIDNFASSGLVNAIGISGGNTLGTTGTSAGVIYFQGGNNVTLSGNASTIIIQGGAGGAGGGIAASLSGNTAGALAIVSSGTMILAGGNNITLSQNGQSVTLSGPNTVAQTNQTAGVYASSQTVGQSSSSTYDARSLSLVGQGIVSVGWSNSSLLISATTAQSVQTQNMVSINGSTGSIVFTAGNNITLSQNLSTITVIGPTTVAQTNQSLGVYASSQTVGQSSSSTYDARSLSIVGRGIVSVGWSNSSFLISASTVAQTNQSLGIYASSQTVGQSSSSTYDARSLSVVGQGIVSVGWSNSSLLISATTAQSVQTQNMVSINGSTGNIVFTAGNNITLSQNASTITIIGASGGGAGFTAGLSGGNLSGNTGTTSNEIVFAGGNNITLSGATGAGGMSVTVSAFNQSNQTAGIYASSGTLGTTSSTYDARSLTVVGSGILNVGWSNSSLVLSVPSGGGAGFTAGISGGNLSGNTGTTSNELVLAGGNNITLSGSSGAAGLSVTVSAANQTAATNSQHWLLNPSANVTAVTSNGSNQGVMYVWPFQNQGYISGSRINIIGQLSLTTSSNVSIAGSIVFNFGISTRNVSTLSSLSSGALSYSFTNTSNNSTASLSGMRFWPLVMNVNLTPGDYFLGLWQNTTSAGANSAIMNMPFLNLAFANFSGYIGSANNKSIQEQPGWGVLSVTTANMPVSVALSDLSAGNIMKVPHVGIVNYTV